MTALPSRPLGRTGMQLSTVGLGAWAMGGAGWEASWGEQDDDESVATIVHAVECGVNWVDTAPIYGHGHSEDVVGRALAAIPAADRPYVFTQVRALVGQHRPDEAARPGHPPHPPRARALARPARGRTDRPLPGALAAVRLSRRGVLADDGRSA